MTTLLLTLIDEPIGPALHSPCVFGVRAAVFSEDLAHVEIAGVTLMAAGGGLCSLDVLAEPPSAAKAMQVTKSLRNHNSTQSALIKEHKSKELANGNPHFAAGSLGGRNSKDLGDSSFSSRAGGDFDISSEYEALAKSRRAQLVQYADRRARNEYET